MDIITWQDVSLGKGLPLGQRRPENAGAKPNFDGVARGDDRYLTPQDLDAGGPGLQPNSGGTPKHDLGGVS